MRILLLCNSRLLGGAELHTVTLAYRLAHRGHDVLVAAPRASGVLTALRGLDGITTVPLDLGPKLRTRTALDLACRWPLYRARVRRFLIDQSAAHGIDVVHLPFKKEQLLVTPIASDMGIPVIWTEHGPLPRTFARMGPARALYRRVAQRTHAVLCVSGAVLNDLTGHGVPRDRLVICYNGVNLAEPKPLEDREVLRERLGLWPEHLAVGSVSRLVPLKGIQHLIDAIPAVVKEVPDARFLIVGDGPYGAALRRRAIAVGAEPYTTFTGHRDDVAHVLGALDLFVTPTLAEGFSLSAVEALAASVPVVATRVGGLPEVLAEGRAGVLVAPGQASALASAIIELLLDPARRETLAEAGRARAESTFSLDRMVDQVEGEMERAVRSGTPTPCPVLVSEHAGAAV